MRCKVLFYCLLFVVLSACAQGKTMFDADLLLSDVKILASDMFEGRKTGTEGSKKARNYIINQFETLEVKPLINAFEQGFDFSYANQKYTGTNVLGIIHGATKPEEYIVISAHYDHLGIQNSTVYNGADDNASGVSALLAFAQYFKKNPPKHSVILAAFDAEELGLEGSKYYVKHPIVSEDKIVCNINMDMISRSNNSELFIVGAKTHKSLEALLNEFTSASKKVKLTLGHDGSDNLEDWTYSSDHASFYRKEIPFLYFGVADHKDYHKHTDDYDKIHPDFYKEVVRQIILLFNKIDQITF
ncbi:M28 family peptidase [Hyunsoonleella jejuensis]|nr:M28 family peptidase [Hyunsoonleella jejuensis]